MNKLNVLDLHFCVRRLPKNLRSMMQRNKEKIIVAGGYIRSIIAGEEIGDIDVFAGGYSESMAFATELQGEDKLYTTANALTVMSKPITVQFIFRWVFDNPVDVVKSFDFSISQAAFWFDTEFGKWDSSCGDGFYQDLAAKRLTYLSPVRNEDAGGSLLRVLKYYQRGYRIPLDSLGAVIARLIQTGGLEKRGENLVDEAALARAVSSLLFEVDPNGVVDHQAYLPSEAEVKQNERRG